MLSPLLRHLLEQLLTPNRHNPTRAVALIAKPITSRKTAGHSAALIANRAHVIFSLKSYGHHLEYKAKMRPSGVHQTVSIYSLFVSIRPRPPYASFSAVSTRLSFIRPLSPSASVRPPQGADWIFEPKWDGFRFQVIKDGGVRMYSKSGAEYTTRLPRMVEAFSKLPTQSAILDGELVLLDPRGAAHFYRLMAQMRTSHPDESKLMFLVFDLLHQDGVDLRGLPLSERKRDLHRLCAKAARALPA
jgi:hypothetical protein